MLQTRIREGACWGHSSTVGFSHYAIFDVGTDPVRIGEFREWIGGQDIGHKELIRCDRWKMIPSFIVNRADLRKIAPWIEDQPTILILSNCDARDRRPAEYLHRLGHFTPAGIFRSCSRGTAIANGSWVFDPSSGLYFICN